MPLPKDTNFLPDCLFMKLHCEPVQNESLLYVSLASHRHYNLKLTLRFGEQKYFDENCWISLRSGRLRLKLTNSKLLLETAKLTPKFCTDILVENIQENTKDQENTFEVKMTGGYVRKGKSALKTSTKYQTVISQVSYLYGTEEEPVWNFRAQSLNRMGSNSSDKKVKNNYQDSANNLVLEGMLQEAIIGTIETTGSSPKIEALFEFCNEDIRVKQGAISPAKKKKFDSEDIVREWIKKQTQATNIISKVEVIL